MTQKRIGRVAWCVMIAVCLRTAGRAADLPAEVTAALRSNGDQLIDLYVEGAYERRLPGKAQDALMRIGTLESETSFTSPVTFTLWLDGDRVREQIRYTPDQFHRPGNINENSFDSQKFYSGTANPTGPGSRGGLVTHSKSTLSSQEKESPRSGQLFQLWYLEPAGFKGPQASGDLGAPMQSLVLARLSEGTLLSSSRASAPGGALFEVTIRYPEPWMSNRTSPIKSQALGASGKLQERVEKDRRMLVGRTRAVTFTLDPSMHYAVTHIREVREPRGELISETQNSEFVDLGQGLWLPKSCKVISYANILRPVHIDPEPTFETIFTIKEIARKPLQVADFQIWFDVPGVKVTDFTHASASPGHPFQYEVAGPLEKPSGRGLRSVLIVINVIVAVVLIAVLLRRSRRPSQA